MTDFNQRLTLRSYRLTCNWNSSDQPIAFLVESREPNFVYYDRRWPLFNGTKSLEINITSQNSRSNCIVWIDVGIPTKSRQLQTSHNTAANAVIYIQLCGQRRNTQAINCICNQFYYQDFSVKRMIKPLKPEQTPVVRRHCFIENRHKLLNNTISIDTSPELVLPLT